MALAKHQKIPHHSTMNTKVPNCVFSEPVETTSVTVRRVNEYHKSVIEEDDGSQTTNALSNDSGIMHSPSLSCSGKGYTYKDTSYQLHGEESLINFKGYRNLMQDGESLLSFQHNMLAPNNCYLKDISQKEYCVWENNLHLQGHNHRNHNSPRSTEDMRLVQDFNCFQTASGYSSMVDNAKEKQHGESSSAWLYTAPTIPNDRSLHKLGAREIVLQKRPSMGESMKAAKKQCSTENKTPKHKSTPSKDPQSVAAKNRRERISERLKILQELVPNGSKVDMVTMLEKAISYVKFLQLQVKVLATDELWPAQGGKPPDISQVKEVIDAIRSSQRER